MDVLLTKNLSISAEALTTILQIVPALFGYNFLAYTLTGDATLHHQHGVITNFKTCNILTTDRKFEMARQAVEPRRAVTFGTTYRKPVNDTPIAIDLLNQALNRKTKAKPAAERPVSEKFNKHASKQIQKPKTVSVAGLFRKKVKQAVRDGRNRRKEPTPEPNMMDSVLGEPSTLLFHIHG
jgi:hypothetical protein